MRRRLLLLGCALATALASASVRAQNIGVDHFEPALGWQNFLTVHGRHVVPHRQFGLVLYFDYQRDPFHYDEVTIIGGSMNVRRRVTVVQNDLQAYIGAAFGLFDRLQLGVALPVALSLTSPATENV